MSERRLKTQERLSKANQPKMFLKKGLWMEKINAFVNDTFAQGWPASRISYREDVHC